MPGLACDHISPKATADAVSIRPACKAVIAPKAADRVGSTIAKNQIAQRPTIKHSGAFAVIGAWIGFHQRHAAKIGRRQLAGIHIQKAQNGSRRAIVAGQNDCCIQTILHNLQTAAFKRVRGAGAETQHIAQIAGGEIRDDVFGNLGRDGNGRHIAIDIAARAPCQRIDRGISDQIAEDIVAIPAIQDIGPVATLNVVIQCAAGDGVVAGIAVQGLPADTQIGLHAFDNFGNRQRRSIGQLQHLDTGAIQTAHNGDAVVAICKAQRQVGAVQTGGGKTQLAKAKALKLQRIGCAITGVVNRQQAIAACEHIGVGPGAAGRRVVARPGLQRVIAGAAVQHIVARTAQQQIVTACTVQRIITAQAGDRVGQGTAAQGIVATRSSQRKGNQIVRVPDGAISKGHHLDCARCEGSAQRHPLFVRQQQDQVVSSALHRNIRRGKPCAKRQKICARCIVDYRLTVARCHAVGIITRAPNQGIGPDATVQRIGPFACQQAVSPGAALQIVISQLAAQRVITARTCQRVARSAANQQIVTLPQWRGQGPSRPRSTSNGLRLQSATQGHRPWPRPARQLLQCLRPVGSRRCQSNR